MISTKIADAPSEDSNPAIQTSVRRLRHWFVQIKKGLRAFRLFAEFQAWVVEDTWQRSGGDGKGAHIQEESWSGICADARQCHRGSGRRSPFAIVDDTFRTGTTAAAIIAKLEEHGLAEECRVIIAAPLWTDTWSGPGVPQSAAASSA